MIVLLSYSTNCLSSNIHDSSTGVVEQTNDSIKVAIDDIRVVNSKLIELEYEKQINSKLKTIIHNDSIVVSNYKSWNNKLESNNKDLNKKYNKAVKQRNILAGISGGAIVALIICLFAK